MHTDFDKEMERNHVRLQHRKVVGDQYLLMHCIQMSAESLGHDWGWGKKLIKEFEDLEICTDLLKKFVTVYEETDLTLKELES